MGSDPTLETGAEPVRNAVGRPNPGGHGPGLIANGGRPDACVIQKERSFCIGGSAPNPRDFTLYRQDSLGAGTSCARSRRIPAAESALRLRLRRAVPSARVQPVYRLETSTRRETFTQNS